MIRRAHMALPGLLGLLLLSGCEGTDAAPADAKKGEGADAPVPVQVAPVRRETVASLYATSATLRAEKQAIVAARTHGVVRRLLVEEGDDVAEEQPVAELEDRDQKIEAERARVVVDTTRRALERMERLQDGGARPVTELETAQRDHDEAKHRLAVAELALTRTVIRAPFAGRIVKRHVDLGATVSDGTSLFDLADCDPLMADIAVPERSVARLAVGQTVRLLADASGAALDAKIERIAPSVETTTGTVKVTLSISAGGGALRPGAFVRVGIVTELHQEALVVPRNALVPEGRRWHVFRIAEGDSEHLAVEQIEVALGFEEGDKVEVLPPANASAFLSPGQRVVVIGAAALAPGRKVSIPPPALPTPPVEKAGEPTASAPSSVSRG